MKKITLLLAISCTVLGFSQTFPSPYCGISMASVYEVEVITQVSLNNVAINNSDDVNVHIDATSNVINVELSETYTIEVKGNSYGDYYNQFNMYIDWNQNSVLNDVGENYVNWNYL